MNTFNMMATNPSIQFFKTEGPWPYIKKQLVWAPNALSGVIFAVTFGLN